MSSSIPREIEVLDVAVSDLTYIPSGEQRKLKQAFWQRFSSNPLCDPRDLTLRAAQRLVNDSRLDRWWDIPGFKEWFANQEEFRERVEYLANLALDSLEKILVDDQEKGVSKVNAAKLLMEVARKMPPKHIKEIYSDKKIGEMDTKQLEEFIRRNTRHLGPVVDATTIEESVSDKE